MHDTWDPTGSAQVRSFLTCAPISYAILRIVKVMAAQQLMNDLFKDVGYVRELTALMQTTEDGDILAEVVRE